MEIRAYYFKCPNCQKSYELNKTAKLFYVELYEHKWEVCSERCQSEFYDKVKNSILGKRLKNLWLESQIVASKISEGILNEFMDTYRI